MKKERPDSEVVCQVKLAECMRGVPCLTVRVTPNTRDANLSDSVSHTVDGAVTESDGETRLERSASGLHQGGQHDPCVLCEDQVALVSPAACTAARHAPDPCAHASWYLSPLATPTHAFMLSVIGRAYTSEAASSGSRRCRQ